MSIQWGRVLLAAFLMELVLFAIAVPLNLSGAGRVNLYVIPPAALIATFAITVWLGRRIKSKFVLHGVLIGVVGTLMYVAITRGQPERKSTRLNSSHVAISYAVFCLKKKKNIEHRVMASFLDRIVAAS